jgi:hypothetical protein
MSGPHGGMKIAEPRNLVKTDVSKAITASIIRAQ